MTKRLTPHGERSIYKPSHGFFGFTVEDDTHRPSSKIVSDSHLTARFTSAVQVDNGKPWLAIELTETSPTKAGPRSRDISVTLDRDGMTALRDTINAALEKMAVGA